ncbi:MAG TPA: hypothetical protein VGH04_12565 [Gemmatimonadaceae bacterium]|jgi:hypothetical protein
MAHDLERDVRFLKRYAVAMTAFAVVATTGAFARGTHEKFTEIDVERINVVEPNGHYRMVIANRPRSIGPIYKGEPFGYRGGTRPGIIFFNDEGTENGGLTFAGSTCADSTSITTGRRCTKGTYSASTHMSFDQFNQDQVLNLDYGDDNGRRVIGVSVNDRPNLDIHDLVIERDSIMKIADPAAQRAALAKWQGPRNGVPLVAQRLFVGRDNDRSAIVNLRDPNGRPRLRLLVDSLGSPRIEFLNEAGQVTYTLTDSSRRR